MNVVITGIGGLSALGTLETTWTQILAGQSGIHQHQPFPEIPPKPIGLIGQYPTQLDDLTRQVVTDAIANAGLTPPLPNCAVVIGSSRGNQSQWEKFSRSYGSHPSHTDTYINIFSWLDTLPHRAAVLTAQMIGTMAAVRSPMAACATGLWALAQGYELIASGDYDRVIAGAIEAPITPLTLTGFAQMGALAETGAYPFDRDREGLVLGEGGAVFVLESERLAQHRAAKIYGQIRGIGLTADAYHISAPQPNSQAAIAAVNRCLARSGISHHDIDWIHAHGTATQLNDRNEASLIQKLFPPEVPVTSTKGATGHTIGASGALGVAFSLLALHTQQLPPTVGLIHPEFNLNLVKTTQPAHLKYVLCLSFGFGGQNAAIALSRSILPTQLHST